VRKVLAITLTALLGSICHAQTKPASPDRVEASSCLVVKHAGGFSAFANNANWEYVAGDFPNGMKWKGHLTYRNIRQIKAKGGQVEIVGDGYTDNDIAQAEKRCADAAKNSPEKKH
jgi:hypothetical protein